MSSRPMLAAQVVASYKRERITEALAGLVSESSYSEAKISDIVKRAGVARKTFYDNFSGKDECFTAMLDAAAEDLLGRIEEAISEPPQIEQRVAAALRAVLEFMEDRPQVARCLAIESLRVAPQVWEALTASLNRLSGLPKPVDEMVVGGISHIIHGQILEPTLTGEELERELLGFAVGFYEKEEAAVA